MKNSNIMTEAEQAAVCMSALADLWERDIAELKSTKQPGGAAVIRQLKSGVKEIRREYPRRRQHVLP